MENSDFFKKISLKVPAPLDSGFCPAALFNREYQAEVRGHPRRERVLLALERENSCLSRMEIEILPLGSQYDAWTYLYVERMLKFLLWARGGWRVYFSGPKSLGDYLRDCYSPSGIRSFDTVLMSKAYERPFELHVVRASEIPEDRHSALKIGGHLNGCRIGFDLGASDYKVAAVIEGQAVYSEEFKWNPKDQSDASYHYRHINAGLKKAAAHMPRVDAIGGSSAGIIVGNRIMAASLFRGIAEPHFESEVKPMFLRLGQEWGVPLEAANDGDVTALAGSLSYGENAVLGIAMGSSQAGGFLNPQGVITGWLNELAFSPVDYSPQAAVDEWSRDCGVGAMYFSQQAVNKLIPAAGLQFPPDMPQPERLEQVQELMARGDKRARAIFETIGVYLGYSIRHYADFYPFANLMVLGRVISGEGGSIIIAKAKEVMESEFPGLLPNIKLRLPGEESKRVGQAIAAASLPNLSAVAGSSRSHLINPIHGIYEIAPSSARASGARASRRVRG